jgi:hypothetical protein
MYHPGKMYNRPMCGRSTGTYTNLGDLQRDLMGVKSHHTKKKNKKKQNTKIRNGPQKQYWTKQKKKKVTDFFIGMSTSL